MFILINLYFILLKHARLFDIVLNLLLRFLINQKKIESDSLVKPGMEIELN